MEVPEKTNLSTPERKFKSDVGRVMRNRELENLIKKEFSKDNTPCNDDEGVRVEIHGCQYNIEIFDMYELPELKLEVWEIGDKIKELLGLKEIDLDYEIWDGGCETCEFGSKYGWSFKGFK